MVVVKGRDVLSVFVVGLELLLWPGNMGEQGIGCSFLRNV